MTREDFEQWVEDHKDEAIERIEADRMTLKNWVYIFGKSLTAMLAEYGDTEDDEAEIESGLNFEEM